MVQVSPSEFNVEIVRNLDRTCKSARPKRFLGHLLRFRPQARNMIFWMAHEKNFDKNGFDFSKVGIKKATKFQKTLKK